MKRLRLIAGCLWLAASGPAAEFPSCGLVPGWIQKGPAREFVSDNLYDYINGNSEGYLIYGFQNMRGVTCVSGDRSIVFDVSELPDSESAYGLFTSNRDPREPLEKAGMGAQVLGQRAIFAKGSYFVEFAASPPDQDHRDALRAFLLAAEKLVEGTTALPDPVGWFPAEGLDHASIRLVPQSVLGLSLLKRGYVAQYEFGRAVIIQESSPELASALMGRLRQRFGQTEAASVAGESFTGSDKYLGRLVFFRKGAFIGGFVNVGEGQDLVASAAALAARIP